MLQIFCIFLFIPAVALTLTLGTITDRPSKYYPKYRALASYIGKKLAEVGFEEDVKVRFARNIRHMIDLMKKGEVDIFIDSVYPVLAVCGEAQCRPVLVRWKDGVRSYRSVIFVRTDSHIKDLADLEGLKVAFDAPYSTSGYLLPKAMLRDEGLRLIRLRDIYDEVPGGYVGYLFAGQEENVVAWVYLGKVDAGAIDDHRLKELSKGKNVFRIVKTSWEFPRHIVSFSKNLNPSLAALLEDILTSMDTDPEGSEVLETFDRTARFEKLTEEDLKRLNLLRNMMR